MLPAVAGGHRAARDEQFTDYTRTNKLTPLNFIIYMDEHMSRAFDPVQLLLDDLRDILFERLGVGARIGDADGQRWQAPRPRRL